jgi:hypothetical protein
MDKRPTAWVATAMISASLSSPLAAHHSYINSPFDPCQSKSIEGEIQGVTWKAPHVWFTVKLDDSTDYQVEWVGPAGLVNWIVTPPRVIEAADLPVGGRIRVTGSPHPSQNVISLLTEVRVITGELNWSRPRPAMVQSCAASQQ